MTLWPQEGSAKDRIGQGQDSGVAGQGTDDDMEGGQMWPVLMVQLNPQVTAMSHTGFPVVPWVPIVTTGLHSHVENVPEPSNFAMAGRLAPCSASVAALAQASKGGKVPASYWLWSLFESANHAVTQAKGGGGGIG